jgi:hypothetical protein
MSLTRHGSAVVGHTFYAYELRNVVGLPPGLQTQMNRPTGRIGRSLAVPLYRRFTEPAPQPGGRN